MNDATGNDATDAVARMIKKSAPQIEISAGNADIARFRETRIDSLGLDSLDSMELVMGIEHDLGVMLDEEKVLACTTIGELIDVVADAATIAQ